MILHTKDYRFDADKFYEAKIIGVEERTGNFGEYYIFNIETPFGKSNYLASGRKVNNVMNGVGIDVQKEMEISFEDVVGKHLEVSLGINDKGFVEIRGIKNKLQEMMEVK